MKSLMTNVERYQVHLISNFLSSMFIFSEDFIGMILLSTIVLLFTRSNHVN